MRKNDLVKTSIALLRGINVSGRNKLPMRDLTSLLDGLGLRDVKTYIQSGNVVFRGDVADSQTLAEQIGAAINKNHGFTPQVLLVKADDFQQAIAANPFPEGEAEPKTLHLYFLASVPTDPDLEKLESARRDSEQFQLEDAVFYLYAPEGIGRSKLAERVERALGVPATARNWRSVCRIWELAESIDDDTA